MTGLEDAALVGAGLELLQASPAAKLAATSIVKAKRFATRILLP
ncbi:MAG: hypothetical protein ACRD3A_00615 [Terriglobales bacterium]